MARRDDGTFFEVVERHTAVCRSSFEVFSGGSGGAGGRRERTAAAASYFAACGKTDGFFAPTLPDPRARPYDVVQHVMDAEAAAGRPTWVWVTEPEQWELALQLWQSGFRTVGHLSLMRRPLVPREAGACGCAEQVRPAAFGDFRGLYRRYLGLTGGQESDVDYFARDDVLADDAVDAVLLRIGGAAVAGAMAVSAGSASVVYRVVTMPEHRGRGIGRAVMRTLMSRLAERGQSEVLLQATAPGRPLYLRLGFVDEGHISLWQSGQSLTSAA